MYEIRRITGDDAALFRSRVSQGFGQDADSDRASAERFEAIFDYERTLAAFDGDEMVGTCAGFSLGVTVPGGAEVPMGGTTVVTVRPTHRRRGVLRSLMEAHLDDIESRGEPLAGLWSSEGGIYGRFGYGPATQLHDAKVDARRVSFREERPAGSVRLVEGADAEHLMRSVYEQARPLRAGMLTRSDAWWTHRLMADPESWRRGKSAQRHVFFEEGGEVTGYATYRQKSKWDDALPDGEVVVTGVFATTRGAHGGLWRYLTSIDLFPNVEYWNLPVDDPLPLAITNHRVVSMKLEDALWMRLMDVSIALHARTYEYDGVVVFTVQDSTRPGQAGTYRLEVIDGVGRCERVDASPDLELDIEALSRLYLGGGDARALAAAGRIEGESRAVTMLHRIMRTDLAPWCPEVF